MNQLRKLLSLSADEKKSRVQIAKQCKDQGRKIIGVGCSHVPEELIHAAGLIPWRLTGVKRSNLTKVAEYRPITWTEPYVNHVLESAFCGDYDYLDGMVCTNWNDDRRQLYDIWNRMKFTPFVHFMHLPRNANKLAVDEYMRQINILKNEIEKYFKVTITDSALWESINLYNKWRELMMEIYGMRTQEVPVLSGEEAMRISTASFFMPMNELVKELELIIAELKNGRKSTSSREKRIIVTGDFIDDPKFINLIEKSGALVVMDDLETTSRNFWGEVEVNGDPIYALAHRYIVKRVPGPRAFFWGHNGGGLDQLIKWYREYKCDGIIELALRDSFARLFVRPQLTKRLALENIPGLNLDIEYNYDREEQLRTRIEAFIESL